MSEESKMPSAEAVREARNRGFQDAVSYMPEDRQSRLTGSYGPQADRREKNINDFVSTIRGGE